MKRKTTIALGMIAVLAILVVFNVVLMATSQPDPSPAPPTPTPHILYVLY